MGVRTRKEMKPEIIIGHFDLGPESVLLVARDGFGGSLTTCQGDGKCGKISVGLDEKRWWQVVSTLFHEAMEYAMIKVGSRYSPSPDYSQDHGNYVFYMTHVQFAEASARVGMFVEYSIKKLEKQHKKRHKRRT